MSRRRFMAVRLPYFAVERLRCDPLRPLAAICGRDGRSVLTAANRAAVEAGCLPGMTLTDARAVSPGMSTVDADPRGDVRDIGRLADWCGRYTPLVGLHGTEALLLDITGAEHLFGGEAAMLERVCGDLARLGHTVCAALADTPLAALAFARCGSDVRHRSARGAYGALGSVARCRTRTGRGGRRTPRRIRTAADRRFGRPAAGTACGAGRTGGADAVGPRVGATQGPDGAAPAPPILPPVRVPAGSRRHARGYRPACPPSGPGGLPEPGTAPPGRAPPAPRLPYHRREGPPRRGRDRRNRCAMPGTCCGSWPNRWQESPRIPASGRRS